LPSTRPFHGLGSVGSGGAYRGPTEAVAVAAIASKGTKNTILTPQNNKSVITHLKNIKILANIY
jgi:hypothetical protein